MKNRFSAAVTAVCFLCIPLLMLSGCASSESGGISFPDDGEYTVEVELEGGSGKASVTSPATLISEDGEYTALIEWSSPYYDYMVVDGETYLPVNEDGNSVFEIPVTVFDEPVEITADTTAMSTPHEIEYTLTFYYDTIAAAGETSDVGEDGTDADGASGGESPAEEDSADSDDGGGSDAADSGDAEYDTDISAVLSYEGSMELEYATEFSVDYYSGGYALLTIADADRFLVVPEGCTAPDDLDDDITVLVQPVENIYLVASAVMDMFISMDALDSVRFTGTDSSGWYLTEAVEAMESGDILYAGKYSAPDYEQILAEGCELAIENTMIYHTPEVQEQLERVGIPVMVDHSSYEAEPLGRTEWVKLYGVLLGREEEAEEAFAGQMEAFASIEDADETGLTVAFFYITTSGEVNVRKSSDYIAKMINMAGGEYIFSDLGDEDDTSSTVTMQMEEFYAAARDADYLIYNSTIDGELSSVDELLGKSSLLANFKAVEEGDVYCTTDNLYQSSMELGDFVLDINKMLCGEEESLTFIYRLK